MDDTPKDKDQIHPSLEPVMTEEEYRVALKKRLTDKAPPEAPVFYSKTGFRKEPPSEPGHHPHPPMVPRRRLGLAMMLPLLLIFMIAGNLRGVVVPLMAAVLLYLLIKRKR